MSRMTYGVATGHVLTTASAEAALQEGGNAIDACIAAAFTAFVVEPVLAGPLGGGFLMVAPTSGAPRCLDAFVQTPRQKKPENDLDLATITVDFGTDTQNFDIGAGTIAAPCLIPALLETHARQGRMPLPELVATAVGHARSGHAVSPFQAHVMELVGPILRDSAAGRALYLADDTLLAAGAVLRNPALADVLEVLALEGARFFTEGEVAAALLALPGGHLGPLDLRRAAPVWRTPAMVRRGGCDIALTPFPSLGGVQVALALETLPHRPCPETLALGLGEIARLRRDHGIDRAPELATERLLDPAIVARLRGRLAGHRPATRGTTHISVIDADGMGASLTLSNGEGCGRILPGTGIMPNNMLGEDDLCPDGPLAWERDRRLSSMMCPMAIRQGRTLTMLGSGGSKRIPSALTQVALRLIDFGDPLDTAIASARLHADAATLSFENIGGEGFHAALTAVWPEARVWQAPHMFFGGVHGVRATARGVAEAAGDPRREGATARRS